MRLGRGFGDHLTPGPDLVAGNEADGVVAGSAGQQFGHANPRHRVTLVEITFSFPECGVWRNQQGRFALRAAEQTDSAHVH